MPTFMTSFVFDGEAWRKLAGIPKSWAMRER